MRYQPVSVTWPNPPSPGTPVRFLTGGLKGAPPELDGVVEELVAEFALSVFGEDGTRWLVFECEHLETYEVH